MPCHPAWPPHFCRPGRAGEEIDFARIGGAATGIIPCCAGHVTSSLCQGKRGTRACVTLAPRANECGRSQGWKNTAFRATLVGTGKLKLLLDLQGRTQKLIGTAHWQIKEPGRIVHSGPSSVLLTRPRARARSGRSSTFRRCQTPYDRRRRRSCPAALDSPRSGQEYVNVMGASGRVQLGS